MTISTSKMKTIAIGDIHGRNTWRRITSENDFDKCVFIGDYFDTHEGISPRQQIENFKELIAFKKENSSRVILLFGNHDYHYLRTAHEKYSGFQYSHQIPIQHLLHEAIDEQLLQMCYVSGNILFTHAGVTKTWCESNGIDSKNIERSLNALFTLQPGSFRFTPGENFSPTGDDICQSPVWVRPDSLLKDRIDNYAQVVGHTQQDKIIATDDVILIDTLGISGEWLQIVDGFITVNR